MDRWVGKVAVVTGASAGIGKSVVQRFVEHGLQVAGLARRVELVEEHAKSLSGPGALHAVKCDVSHDEEVKAAFEWVLQNLGPVSILVNNAAIIRNNSFLDGDPSQWKQVLDINLYGTAICSHQAVQQMRAAGIDGHIININSISGHRTIDVFDKNLSLNMYPVSKHGITAYSEIMRQELRNNALKIKVTSLSPGVVDTDIYEAGGLSKEFTKISLSPEDIADAIIYVLGTKPNVQVGFSHGTNTEGMSTRTSFLSL